MVMMIISILTKQRMIIIISILTKQRMGRSVANVAAQSADKTHTQARDQMQIVIIILTKQRMVIIIIR